MYLTYESSMRQIDHGNAISPRRQLLPALFPEENIPY
jgi:hypothetical protein